MSKITLATIANLQNEATAVNAINANDAILTTAIDNTLSRDGTSPNQMGAALDMNNFQIINLPTPSTVNSPARLIDVVSNPSISVPGTGTSGHVVPFLDGANTWSGTDTFNLDVYMKSGRPWADVRAYGAVGNGSTDDSTAFTNAIAAIAGIGGIVYVPPGNYVCLSGITINNSSASVWLLGAGLGSVEIQCGAADVTLLTINGSARHRISNITFAGSTTVTTTHPCIDIGSNCVELLIDHCLAINGKYVVRNAATDVSMRDCNFSQAYGPAIIYTTGQFWGNRLKCDQQFPQSVPSAPITYNAWQASPHNYNVLGTIVTLPSGFNIQLTATGTSGAVAPTPLPYGTNITDGSCTWRLVAPTTYASIQVDTGSTVVTLDQIDMSGPFTYGLLISNSLGGTAPQNVSITNSFFGFCHDEGIAFNAGAGLMVKGCQFASMLGANSQAFNSGSGNGDVLFSGNIIISSPFGITINSGINHSIVNNNIFGCSGAAIFTAATVNRITIVGNNLGSSTTWGTNAIGIQLSAGASDFIIIDNNVTQGASTELSNGSTGTHNSIRIGKDLAGTITNDNAPAGFIGEILVSDIQVGSAISLTTATSANITSLTLTPGDWDVDGTVVIVPSSTVTIYAGWVSTTSATLPTNRENIGGIFLNQIAYPSAVLQAAPTGTARVSINANTSVFLSTQCTFAGTCTAYGYLRARRVR